MDRVYYLRQPCMNPVYGPGRFTGAPAAPSTAAVNGPFALFPAAAYRTGAFSTSGQQLDSHTDVGWEY